MPALEDAATALLWLASYGKAPGDPQAGHYTVPAAAVHEATKLPIPRLNDAVVLLAENGYAELIRLLGTAPFAFAHIKLTPRGRVEAERLTAGSRDSAESAAQRGPAPVQVPTVPIPVGSPFGFTDQDWEAVTLARGARDRIVVVFGFQWQSTHYDSIALLANVNRTCSEALAAVAARLGVAVSLDFKQLRAGYGEHLFNQIARDIISADIAVFDTSDLNPNVMLEMGVALTWGVRCHPIRKTGTPPPPSDVSGQTWAQYDESGARWLDPDHEVMLGALVERAVKKKGPPRR